MKLRTVQVLRDGVWAEVRLWDVRKGELFRMWEVDSDELITLEDGRREFIALGDGYRADQYGLPSLRSEQGAILVD